jgi:nitrite reductase (NADH) large subunit
MRPRHADLFATGLDDVTLIQYIDRIMMFYIRTADRLQRTSVWMENMEGGLAYLKKVVIDDALGLCGELEAQMAYNISQYQCEWKTTVENEALQKRFKHFINSNATDSNLAYVVERDQIRPATAEERSSSSIQFVELVD